MLICSECQTDVGPFYLEGNNATSRGKWVCKDHRYLEPMVEVNGVKIKRKLVDKQISAATEAHLKDKVHNPGGKGFTHISTGRPWHWQGS